MKFGRQHIHDLPASDIMMLGSYADRLQREAEARGEQLPPPVRLQIGEPAFRTPAHIREAAIASIASEMQTYGPPAGWHWLRELIADKIRRVNGYNVTPDNIAITVGGTGAIQTALLTTVGSGDEVLIPDPCWPPYPIQIAASGATIVPYPLDPQSDWFLDIASLERLVTPRTRLLMINSPGNPTGSVFPASLMQDLLDFACRHDLYLLSDECYDQIVFEGEHISPATMLSPEEFESGRFIGIYTFSKSYAMTGWRIGYVVTSRQLIKTLTDILIASYSNLSTMVQRAAAAALTGPQDCVQEMCKSYQGRRDLAVRLLKEHNRYIYTPHGAFYTLIDVRGKNGISRKGRQFTLDLLHDRNIAVASGTGFGQVSAEYVRISLAASDEEIERGVREICLFADR